MIRRILATALLSIPAIAMAAEPVTKSGNFVCRGGHDRCSEAPKDYGYHQFAGEKNVGDFAGYSEVLHEDGKPQEHHQTFLSEVLSFKRNTNAVAIWGDGGARVNDARVWGGFFSARSGLKAWEDAQLVGLEVDVLNGGQPGVHPNKSKVGIQVVGFGQVNSNALEVLSENEKSGQFMNGVNIKAGAIHRTGTVFGVEPQQTTIGLNMQYSKFRDSAILLSEGAPITFRQKNGKDAKVYRAEDGTLVLQAGNGGLRIESPDGKVLLDMGNHGEFYDSAVLRRYVWIPVAMGVALVFMVLLSGLSILQTARLQRELRRMRSISEPAARG